MWHNSKFHWNIEGERVRPLKPRSPYAHDVFYWFLANISMCNAVTALNMQHCTLNHFLQHTFLHFSRRNRKQQWSTNQSVLIYIHLSRVQKFRSPWQPASPGPTQLHRSFLLVRGAGVTISLIYYVSVFNLSFRKYDPKYINIFVKFCLNIHIAIYTDWYAACWQVRTCGREGAIISIIYYVSVFNFVISQIRPEMHQHICQVLS